MDIVSRLKLFLKQNGIANSQFADTCEIPRPTLSQLLNGRNKKVSDEIITKIHTAYPALNIMWLMFGDGDMFVPNANNPYPIRNEFQSNSPAENSLFGNNSADVSNTPVSQAKQPISFSDNDSTYNAHNQPNAMAAAIRTMMQAGGNPSTGTAQRAVNGEPRHVTSIMVFYSDNSFESFTPA